MLSEDETGAGGLQASLLGFVRGALPLWKQRVHSFSDVSLSALCRRQEAGCLLANLAGSFESPWLLDRHMVPKQSYASFVWKWENLWWYLTISLFQQKKILFPPNAKPQFGAIQSTIVALSCKVRILCRVLTWPWEKVFLESVTG